MCWYIALALCGNVLPVVRGGGIVPCALSCSTLDLAVSLRDKLGPNVEDIIFVGIDGCCEKKMYSSVVKRDWRAPPLLFN